MTTPNFLEARAASYQKLAATYLKLNQIVRTHGLKAVSGDVEKLTDFQSLGLGPDKPTYWPIDFEDGDRGVIELRDKQDRFLVRLEVNTNDFYGCSRYGSGNHDWSSGELQRVLIDTMARLVKESKV
jgi:hypothetical protein